MTDGNKTTGIELLKDTLRKVISERGDDASPASDRMRAALALATVEQFGPRLDANVIRLVRDIINGKAN